ncbi:MAG TPA: hypothetical protein VMD97_01090 [Candidatus Aquilonibacter sp.]|nr:hypothetical protein [Candidatus Aquilonibacter sp.]
MKFRAVLLAALTITLTFSLAANAQENGPWRASSSNARAITGDVVFSPTRIDINFTAYTIAQIRSLTTEEIRALFNPDNPVGGGNLFRVNIPADKKFLHHNTLCGSDDTQWIVTYAQGRDLQVAFFSGATPPTLTFDAINNSSALCGVFSYVR